MLMNDDVPAHTRMSRRIEIAPPAIISFGTRQNKAMRREMEEIIRRNRLSNGARSAPKPS